MKPPRFQQRHRPAFTVVELLVVVAIIALLVGLIGPSIQYSIRRAQSTKCATQLRGIGVALLSDATDNGGLLPEVNQAALPVYGASVPGLVGVLGAYGVTTNTIECPTDISQGAASSFATYGSSYEWNPVLDDGTDPVTTLALGPVDITVNSSRFRVCTDFLPIHNGKVNALYGDGHTRAR